MPNRRFIEREDYTEIITEWIGLTKEGESMAETVVSSLYDKEIVKLKYKNKDVDVILRSTGEFWLNDENEPFDSPDDFEDWLEEKITLVDEIKTYCKYTDKLSKTIKRTK